MSDKKTHIGIVIRDFRTRRDMSLSALGDASNVSKGIISKMENGLLTNPGIENLAKIAKAMSTRASVLLRTMEQANQ